MDFKQEIIKLLAKETALSTTELETRLTIPPTSEMGDYAFPCFKLGQNPLETAKKLKEKINLPPFLSKIETSGPYLNFYLKLSALACDTLTKIHQEKNNYGKGTEHKKIVIEYCGPNTNKPLHLGHIRNMALGNALCKILSFRGHDVHPVNIINDRGIHICQSLLAYKKWGKKKNPDKKGDHFVGDYYVLFSKKAQLNEKLKAEAQELLQQWEKNDPEIKKLWKKMNQWVLSGFKETYHRFGIKFDQEYFESQYYKKGKKIALEGLKKGIFKKDQTGAIVAPLEEYHLPDKVILRADGTSVYITQDLYLAEVRYQDYTYDQMIYVVASEQNNHFKQLFKISEMLARPYAKKMFHLNYGLVHLPTGRMKSREGTVVDADDIIEETVNLVQKEIKNRHHQLNQKEIKKRSEIIALGAIKFFMLKTDTTKDIIFDPKESLSFEGETGPYVQYTHARAHSILRKAKEEKISFSSKVNFETFNLSEELTLLKILQEFPETVIKTAQNYKPHYLTQYLISLSQAFNEFYHKCPVISQLEHQTKARLLLVESVLQTLKNGLNLLGIEAPEEM